MNLNSMNIAFKLLQCCCCHFWAIKHLKLAEAAAKKSRDYNEAHLERLRVSLQKTHERICLKNSMHFKSWWCERARFFSRKNKNSLRVKSFLTWLLVWRCLLFQARCIFHLSCTEHTLHETSEAEWNLLEHKMLLNSTRAESALTLTCVCVYGGGKSQTGETLADTQIPPPRSNSGFPRHNTQYVYKTVLSASNFQVYEWKSSLQIPIEPRSIIIINTLPPPFIIFS